MDFTDLPSERAPEAGAANRLGRGHRYTQLQGHVIGHGLQEIPEYLLDGVDIRYRRRAGAAREIPFVDAFSINRVLGGYPRLWMERSGRALRDLDFAIRAPSGELEFRPELIRQRLDPYLEAGYRFKDITLNIGHVPWDLAADGGLEGIFGQKNPPADWSEWERLMTAFCSALVDSYGTSASDLRFKIGNEYDTLLSFGGTAEDFYRLYETASLSLQEWLPGAQIMPGEFTGVGRCEPGWRHCVYDTARFVEFAQARELPVDALPRSLHGSRNRADSSCDEAVARAVESYGRVVEATGRDFESLGIEIHQFGLIGQPFGVFHEAGSDPAALQACWQFHTILALRDRLPVRRLAHWGGFYPVRHKSLLDGAGFLRLILDHQIGAEVRPIELGSPPSSGLRGAGFYLPDRITFVMASVDTGRSVGEYPFSLAIPPAWKRLHTTSYDEFTNVFRMIKDDLREQGNLREDYAHHDRLLGEIQRMAADMPAAARLIIEDWPRYRSRIQESLRWKPPSDLGLRLSDDRSRIHGRLRGSTLLVLQLQLGADSR